MTTLNGWQRLWLLASILWAVVILALAGMPDRGWTMQSALLVVRLWIVPVGSVYALGLGLTWVIGRSYLLTNGQQRPPGCG